MMRSQQRERRVLCIYIYMMILEGRLATAPPLCRWCSVLGDPERIHQAKLVMCHKERFRVVLEGGKCIAMKNGNESCACSLSELTDLPAERSRYGHVG
jgi:hypothetical protein